MAQKTVCKNLMYHLELPDGVVPGRWEAAEAFADEIAKLKKQFPDQHWQLIPFNHDSQGELKTILAVMI